MKKLITIIILFIVYNSQAQCIITPQCTNVVTVTCTDLSNQSVNGSPCFEGSGDIPNNYNVNNANYWSFDGDIHNYQNVNLQNNQKFYAKSGHVVCYANLSLGGHDTGYVFNNTSFTAANLIANNGPNIIMMGSNTHFYKGVDNSQLEYFVGDTIHTVPGNSSNDVILMSCNSSSIPLSQIILSFKLNKDIFSWETTNTGIVELQLQDDNNMFRTIYKTNLANSSTKVTELGLYRLKVGNDLSKVIPFNMTKLQRQDNVIYYYQGEFSKQPFPNATYIGTKKIK